MAEIPHEVLSEHFQERMNGRRLRSAVFFTYQFDPGFFEQEVLPVILDIPLSHAVPIRLIQLEDSLRALPGNVAVYYDANGLILGDSGSAKLDIKRIPVQHRTIFHAKNVFLLVESSEPDKNGHHGQALLIACMSANMTRSGWWENIEVCHIEEIGQGDKTRLKDSLGSFLKKVRGATRAEGEHRALKDVLEFLKGTVQRPHRSESGRLYSHFFSGTQSVADFLEQTAGEHIRGTYLEIISPFFDDATQSMPLTEIVDRFKPKEARIFLPRSPAGEVLCRKELFESVSATPSLMWGSFPKEMLKLGKSEDAGERFVHAKVYRFFSQSPKREIYFIGSANLTSAAHKVGGNTESGFLVDVIPPRRPEFWLSPEVRKPTAFSVHTEGENNAVSNGTRLNVRYHWDQSRAAAFWDASKASPPLRLEARGVEIGTLPSLTSRTWIDLTPEIVCRIGELLAETSLFIVHGDGDTPRQLLVQEEGMSHKPSLLLQLSAADILQYWSLLTPEQRAAFIEAHAPNIALEGLGADLVARANITADEGSMFDRFAGFFHAFGCLERAVQAALDNKSEKDATYRLFGKKYDSLGTLLDRVTSEKDTHDEVEHYVIVMCARQLCVEIARKFPDYWEAQRSDVKGLNERFVRLGAIRERLIKQNTGDFEAFLQWFDQWFLRRAAVVEEEV